MVAKPRDDNPQIARERRRLAVLSGCARALIEATDEIKLLTRVCNIIVDTAEHTFVWVGYLRNFGGLERLTPIAMAGGTAELMNTVSYYWRGGHVEGSLADEALEKEQVVVRANLREQKAKTQWHGLLEPFGIEAALALPLKSEGAIFAVITIFSSRPDAFDNLEAHLLEELGQTMSYGITNLRDRNARAAAEKESIKRGEMLTNAFTSTVWAIARAVSVRDPYTAGHESRVAWISIEIAKLLGVESSRIDGINMGASIHDLGKLSIPSEILSKPTRLLPAEFELVKTHPALGAGIVRDIEFPWPIATMMAQHHERMDGSGYPDGRKGEDICFEARIISVADVVEAMASHRPYRPAMGLDRALDEINKGRERLYDAKVVDACGKLIADPKFVTDWQQQAGVWASH